MNGTEHPRVGAVLSEPALECLREIVSWKIANGGHSLNKDVLDREFGREVWEEVSRVGFLGRGMYGGHRLTPGGRPLCHGLDEMNGPTANPGTATTAVVLVGHIRAVGAATGCGTDPR